MIKSLLFVKNDVVYASW